MLGVKIGAEIAGVIDGSGVGEGAGVRVFCALEVACGATVLVEEADCAGMLLICVRPNTSRPENKSSRRPIRTSKEKIPALEKGECVLSCSCRSDGSV